MLSSRGEPGGRWLGLDVGHKTIGVAMTDPLKLTVQGVGVWRRTNRRDDIARLDDFCRKEQVELIVMGYPRRTDGTEGPEARSMALFAEKVTQATGIPVELADERFTTKLAERTLIEAGTRRQRRKDVIDQLAASFILQTYMERKRIQHEWKQ